MSLKELKPKTLDEVRRVVGLFSVYRRFVPNFSGVAKPLYELLKVTGNTSSKKVRMSSKAVVV